MTQEDKQLLMKDLCARLPYGVMVYFEGWNPEKLSEVNLNEDVYNGMGGIPIPYLRPMSSMTKEEEYIYLKLRAHALPFAIVEWLDKNHFDHRTNKDGETLIEIGLALEAPEGMYKTD